MNQNFTSLTKLQAESPGIISRSIANANAEKGPITPARGQENVSLLEQQASKKASPASAQFTFTCDSQVPGTVAWPGPSSATMHQAPSATRMSTHGTQTSPNLPATYNTNPLPQARGPTHYAPNTEKQAPAQGPKKKNRHQTGKEYLISARRRQLGVVGTRTPIRPSLVGALEFRSVLSPLQKAEGSHARPIHLRRDLDDPITGNTEMLGTSATAMADADEDSKLWDRQFPGGVAHEEDEGTFSMQGYMEARAGSRESLDHYMAHHPDWGN